MPEILPEMRTQAVALALTPGIGPKLIGRLMHTFGSLAAILSASYDQLQTVKGIGARTANAIRAVDLARTEADLVQFTRSGGHVLTWLDTEYPARLEALEDKPLVLFCRGKFEPAGSVAIVGTREPTLDSLALARSLAADFAGRGWVVVSGLARGIDAAAHLGALDAGGATWAVLGCGVQVVYPPEHDHLAARIQVNGALLSECHPAARPSATALTLRNRIVTGLSEALIVIEAGATSGALHAARKAQAQGRPIFAVENESAGNRGLLKNGAARLESADQVIGALTIR